MGRWIKWSLLALIGILVLVQFIPVKHDNPEGKAARTIYGKETVPPSIRAVFNRSCGDCHSNQTTWPWYSYVAPASWIIVGDVHDGRKHVNFDEWGDYSAKRREEALENICEEVQQNQMPEPKYVLIHRDARLKQSERDAICRWTEAARQY